MPTPEQLKACLAEKRNPTQYNEANDPDVILDDQPATPELIAFDGFNIDEVENPEQFAAEYPDLASASNPFKKIYCPD